MRQKGFTLIEIMAVVIIIGVLAIIAWPKFYSVVEKSRKAEAINILSRMYKEYRTLIIEEVLIPGGDFTNGSTFSPKESDHNVVDPLGVSPSSWISLGFECNPNMVHDNLYFTYQVLNAGDNYFTHSATGHDGYMPPGSTSQTVGLAFRKTGPRAEYSLFPVNTQKWIFIYMNNGTIVTSSHYQ